MVFNFLAPDLAAIPAAAKSDGESHIKKFVIFFIL